MKIQRILNVCVWSALLLSAVAAASAQKPVKWTGEWSITSRYRPAGLKIKPAGKGKFRFKIEAMSGANMGEIEGLATVRGRQAFFDDRKFAKKKADAYGCQLTFTNKGSLITVDQNPECRSYAGMNVYFGGDYLVGKPRKYTETFVELDVFPNARIEQRFRELTKKDYDTFLDAFHQIYTMDDLDKFGAKVYSGCVEGICPWFTAIIMYDPKGSFWAAVLHDEDGQPQSVRYYTNVAGWKTKLPKSIIKWVDDLREHNDELKVTFMNGK
ncbi:MAG: hypothetical protein JSS81_21515 [Acidobacteria bacterium]|nr:hypothetical protein [Acidobacteriota bacterium]